MRDIPKWIHLRIGCSHVCRSMALAAVLMASSALLIQCKAQPSGGTQDTAASVQTITRSGYTFEIFTTPEQQLHYARTWFSNPNEKRAALELLLEYFPRAKNVRAQAELELAYLDLGGDYRFADSAACLRAIDKYQAVAAQYVDLPSICAKAHWYMGWIYADLLNHKRNAIAHYQTIVKQYPDETLSLKPPVPWVALVLPQAIEKPVAVYEYPIYKWSSIALLEIIRNTECEEEKWIAFETLWSQDRASLAMGYAFRELVCDSPLLAQKVAARAGVYLEARLFSKPIADEVRAALKSLNAGEAASSKQGTQRAP